MKDMLLTLVQSRKFWISLIACLLVGYWVEKGKIEAKDASTQLTVILTVLTGAIALEGKVPEKKVSSNDETK